MRQHILKRVSAPAKKPVTLTDAKLDCRVDHEFEDTLIESLIAAATDYLDVPNGVIGKALITQTWSLSLPLPDRLYRIHLPVTPVQSIQSITYYDAENQTQSLAVEDFYFHGDEDWAYIEPKDHVNWPGVYDRLDAITVTFVAGFGPEPEDVPETIRQAIRLLVVHWFTNRSAVNLGTIATEIPMAAQSLIAINRKGWTY
jgi:uncharacterized phiE125 gp8 family phage protein